MQHRHPAHQLQIQHQGLTARSQPFLCFGCRWKEERIFSTVPVYVVTLTLSNTRRHLSAPHRDDTSFSLSSSWFKLLTHSFTVERKQNNHHHHPLLLFWANINSLQHVPLSTMWSSPPSSRSSSLNQSPARFDVSDSNVSMAKWPVCRERRDQGSQPESKPSGHSFRKVTSQPTMHCSSFVDCFLCLNKLDDCWTLV